MNRIFRNALFYLLIFVVIIGILSLLRGQNDQAEELDVQQFLDALNNGEIKEMTMQPPHGIMRYKGVLDKNDEPFVAQTPDNTEIIADITEQAFEQSILHVEEEEQPSGCVTLRTTMNPFVVIGLIYFFILI